jgi:hypothetical protein
LISRTSSAKIFPGFNLSVGTANIMIVSSQMVKNLSENAILM